MSPGRSTGKEEDVVADTLATCHGIIGHPKQPKFLVIRHKKGWAPPTVMFPPGPIDYKAGMINQGMLNKYGLQTRVLRPLISVHNYHCLEMELAGKGGAHRLDAVWVDRERYERFRTPADGWPDPFAQWLDERERNERPALRSPWQYPGWFDAANHWIQFQLDRLRIQPTGSVEQYRVGWNASCLLRVMTNEGKIYFKAGYAKPPAEAPLTAALAEVWPAHVIAPLAVDADRNWMLTRDLRQDVQNSCGPGSFPEVARVLAEIQVSSVDSLQRWQGLGCPVHDLGYLDRFIHEQERLHPWLLEGGGGLEPSEIESLRSTLERHREICERLAAFGLPNTLVHTDFRADNFALRNGQCAMIDWSDSVIGHPFFSLDYMFEFTMTCQRGLVPGNVVMPVNAGVLEQVIHAYLDPFTRFASPQRLNEALDLVRQLFMLWGFSRIGEKLDWAERGSPRYITLVVRLQNAARQLTAAAS